MCVYHADMMGTAGNVLPFEEEEEEPEYELDMEGNPILPEGVTLAYDDDVGGAAGSGSSGSSGDSGTGGARVARGASEGSDHPALKPTGEDLN